MHASASTDHPPSPIEPTMSKDVRRLFAAQKAAKASGSPSSSLSSSTSASKRVTHPLAKYDPTTFRLTCAICGPNAPIKSDNLWNAHLVSKVHQEAVAKLRAVKEQIQRREAEAAERHRLQQLQQQQQGVKRKAGGGGGGLGGLVAYAEDSESESEDEGSATASVASNDSKRVKLDEPVEQQEEEDLEEEEDAMAGLPAGFFDTPATASSTSTPPPVVEEEEPSPEEPMEGVLPAGFFDDPEEDSRVRAEVGGATADQQQRQIDEEFKALQADLAKDLDRQERQELEQAAQIRPGANSVSTAATTAMTETSAGTGGELPYEDKVELEELELEESIMARSEEEYMLFVEMQERLDALREKKNRIASAPSTPTIASTTTTNNSNTIPSASTKTTKSTKRKTKSILDMVREQERAKREKERLAALEFARLQVETGKDESGDSKMTSGTEDSDEEDSDEDIEAMMDWRAKRV